MSQTIPAQGSYAQINGLKLYYEVHGKGDPLVLLHGGFASTGMFADLIPSLKGRQVIAVDLQAHGRTADMDRPIRSEWMADDIAALIKHLGLEKADIVGYSLGGSVALRTAIQHPGQVRKLVVVSAPFKRSGWYSEMLATMEQMGAHTAEFMKNTPMYQHYAAIAPRPQDWSSLWGKMGDLLRHDYDWSKEVGALQAPTLIVAGDADSLSPAHLADFFGLLGGGKRDGSWDGSGMVNSQLAILPGTTHYNCPDSPLLAPVVLAFLEAPVRKA